MHAGLELDCSCRLFFEALVTAGRLHHAFHAGVSALDHIGIASGGFVGSQGHQHFIGTTFRYMDQPLGDIRVDAPWGEHIQGRAIGEFLAVGLRSACRKQHHAIAIGLNGVAAFHIHLHQGVGGPWHFARLGLFTHGRHLSGIDHAGFIAPGIPHKAQHIRQLRIIQRWIGALAGHGEIPFLMVHFDFAIQAMQRDADHAFRFTHRPLTSSQRRGHVRDAITRRLMA